MTLSNPPQAGVRRPISIRPPLWVLALTSLAMASNTIAQRPDDASSAGGEISARYAFSSRGDLEGHGTHSDVQIDHYAVSGRLALPSGETWRLYGSVFASRDELDLSAPVPLPDLLQSVGLALGASRDLSDWIGPEWTGTVLLSSGFQGDTSGLSGSQFNASGLIRLGYRRSETLAWDFGLGLNLRSEYPVLPFVGVRWAFQPDWSLSIGFPRTEVAWRVLPDLTLKAGARFQGGTHLVSAEHAPGGEESWLDYREIRLGAGLLYQLSPVLSLGLDAGIVLDRRFEYEDLDYTLDGETAGYIAIEMTSRF